MRQAGFTLLELLVGLVVFGLIVAGLSAGTRFTLRAGETQARLINRTSDLDAVERALRRAFAGAAPGVTGSVPLQGGPDRVSWTTTLPQVAEASRVEATLAMDADHRLLLRWSPDVFGQPADAPPHAVELLRGIDHLEIAYWSGEWTRTWNQAELPKLIRLRIMFRAGDPRRWPDMVMSTVLQRP